MIQYLSPWMLRKEEINQTASVDPTTDPNNAASSGKVTDEAAEDTSDEASSVDVADLSGYPWTFNPPIHPSLQHTELHNKKTRDDLRWAYEQGVETANTYGADFNLGSLRLGRLAMGKQAWSYAAQEMGTRFGFRFQYNPGEVKGGTYVNGEFIVNPAVTMASVVQDGLESISFELLLNRMPELQGNATRGDYYPVISDDDLAKIRKYGTHWDLEFLYRVCNGLHETRSSGERTGDIGILLPNPTILYLGPFLSTGNVEMIQAEDTMFTANMVPMLTKVSLVFRRILMMKGSSINEVKKKESSTSSTTGTSSSSSPTGPGAKPVLDTDGRVLTGQQVFNLAKWQGFNDADATLMTKIAFLESSWNPKAKNYIPCLGLWQINMATSMEAGRLKQFGIKTKEELFDPYVNAAAMRKIFDGQGWKAWTTYSNAKNLNKTW